MKRIGYILLVLTLSATWSQAQKTYWVEAGKHLALDGSVAHYEDTSAQLTIRQIVDLEKRRAFNDLPTSVLNRGYTASHHWLHFRLGARTPRTVFVELDNPRINDFWFYQVINNRLVKQVITGDALPFSSRGFPSSNWVFPVALDGKTPTDIFVMVAKRYEVLGVRASLWEADAFERADRKSYLFWGILTGLSILIFLINVVAYAATRETVYFWFVGLIVAIAFHISAQSGLGFQYLWPDSPGFNRLDPALLSGWLIMLAQLQFMQHFIGQRAAHSRAFWAVQTFKYSMLAILALNIVLRMLDVFPLNHFQWTYNTTLAFMVISIGLAFWSIFERIGRRENVVIFYTVTLALQLIGYLLVFFINLAFIRGQEPLFQVDSYVVVVINFLFDLLVLSSGVLYFWFQKYKLQNEQLLTALHRSEQEQSRKIIDALEIERNRISEDLYDDVGAMLSTAIGYLSSALRKPDIGERFPVLAEARKLLDRAVENLRTVSHNLMPKNFAQLGLSKSLAETIDKVADTSSIQFEYMVVGTERRFNASTEVQVFRIASELINDILRNSTATQATVQLIFNHDHLSFITEDDGPRTPDYNNLTSKVDFIQGKLDVDASPHGVTAIVEIPYQ
ncbi:sensor histidine kinase [Spirosoma fluminis]